MGDVSGFGFDFGSQPATDGDEGGYAEIDPAAWIREAALKMIVAIAVMGKLNDETTNRECLKTATYLWTEAVKAAQRIEEETEAEDG